MTSRNFVYVFNDHMKTAVTEVRLLNDARHEIYDLHDIQLTSI